VEELGLLRSVLANRCSSRDVQCDQRSEAPWVGSGSGQSDGQDGKDPLPAAAFYKSFVLEGSG
jgi:hypothetical protein